MNSDFILEVKKVTAPEDFNGNKNTLHNVKSYDMGLFIKMLFMGWSIQDSNILVSLIRRIECHTFCYEEQTYKYLILSMNIENKKPKDIDNNYMDDLINYINKVPDLK